MLSDKTKAAEYARQLAGVGVEEEQEPSSPASPASPGGVAYSMPCQGHSHTIRTIDRSVLKVLHGAQCSAGYAAVRECHVRKANCSKEQTRRALP